jgi:hypothetical protein
MKLQNFFESAIDQNVDYRILSNRVMYDGQGRLDSIQWLNDRFLKLLGEIDRQSKGKLKIVDNQQLIQLTDEFAKYYVGFHKSTAELINMIKGNKENLSPEAQKMIKKSLGATAQLGFEFAQLEAVFDKVTTKLTPNMVQAIKQRDKMYYKRWQY